MLSNGLKQKEMRKWFSERVRSIPKKNKQKFSADLLKLIDKAHEGDYENFNF